MPQKVLELGGPSESPRTEACELALVPSTIAVGSPQREARGPGPAEVIPAERCTL